MGKDLSKSQAKGQKPADNKNVSQGNGKGSHRRGPSPVNRWMSVADPVHGIIRFDRNDETHRLVLDIVNSRPFQRLRRIRQMALAEFVFHGAARTRLDPSLVSD